VKVRPRQKNKEDERCAVCRDGPEGLVVCRGCNTLLHATCLIDVRGCPTIGCNERDPLEKRQDDCSHGTMNAVDNSCYDCGLSYKQMRREKRSTKEHGAIRQAEDGPQKELGCVHRFSPLDHKCMLCHMSDMEVFDRMNAIGAVAYAKEKVVCGSPRCGEPTTRQAQYCSLCYADEACGWAKLPPKRVPETQRNPLLPCKHKFHPKDMHCIHCQKDAYEYCREIFGSVTPSDKEIRKTVQRGWDQNTDFIAKRFQANLRTKDRDVRLAREANHFLIFSVLAFIGVIVFALYGRIIHGGM